MRERQATTTHLTRNVYENLQTTATTYSYVTHTHAPFARFGQQQWQHENTNRRHRAHTGQAFMVIEVHFTLCCDHFPKLDKIKTHGRTHTRNSHGDTMLFSNECNFVNNKLMSSLSTASPYAHPDNVGTIHQRPPPPSTPQSNFVNCGTSSV